MADDGLVLPRWQPDDELSACSICANAFTFLNRRHHCRRCGRLVCGPCSPHRITIPRQYIVHSPEETALNSDANSTSRSNTASLERHHHHHHHHQDNPALGGGETVRVCNPCVPDPNPNPYPPQRYEGNQRSPRLLQQPAQSRSRAQTFATEQEPALGGGISFARIFGSWRGGGELLNPTTCQSAPQNARSLSDFGGGGAAAAAYSSQQPTERRGSYRPQLHTARYQALNSVPQRPRSSTQGLRTRSDNDTTGQNSRSRYRSTAHTTSNIAAAHAAQVQMQQAEGREVLREEDECPVCGTRNYPFDTEGTSEERERHVESCITSHLAGPSYGGTLAATPTAPPDQAVTATAENETVQPTGGGGSGSSSSDTRPRASSSVLATTPTVARQRMLVYHAKEKDCFDEEGQAQECVICFEEFEVGDEMGRLECLCKFHRACIKGWFEKRMGCPTHQLHD
jgi:hypothetical protein